MCVLLGTCRKSINIHTQYVRTRPYSFAEVSVYAEHSAPRWERKAHPRVRGKFSFILVNAAAKQCVKIQQHGLSGNADCRVLESTTDNFVEHVASKDVCLSAQVSCVKEGNSKSFGDHLRSFHYFVGNQDGNIKATQWLIKYPMRILKYVIIS